MKMRIANFAVPILAAFTITVPATAGAGVLLEPYAGYHTGEWDRPGVSAGEDMKGLTFGGRLGFSQMGLMGGIDYMTGAWDDESSPANDVTPADLGVFIGYEFPVMIRAYFTYGFDAELKFKNSTSSNKWEGKTMKFGVGFTTLPMVAINLEYMTGSYDEVNGNDTTAELDTKMFGLTVSLPLTF